MTDAETGQVNRSAAEIYDEFFLPALFDQAAMMTVEAAQPGPGMHVLDVGCGTGALTMRLSDSVKPGGKVTGLDCNEGMLAVASAKSSDIEWKPGQAEALPFDDDMFDAAFCQFGLMFFEDRPLGLQEMRRVTRPGGKVVVTVWDSLQRTPGYLAMTRLLDRQFGRDVARALEAPFVLGEESLMAALFEDAGMEGAEFKRLPVTARFPSLEAWLHTDIRGWTFSDQVDDAGFQRVLAAAKQELAHFVREDGAVEFESPALMVSASAA